MSEEEKKVEPKTEEKTPKNEPNQDNEKPAQSQSQNKITVEHIIRAEEKKQEPKTERKEENKSEEKTKPNINPQPAPATSDETIKDLQKQLEEREAELAAIALKSFENDKKALLDVVDEGKRVEVESYIGDDPAKLEQVKFFTNLQVKGLEEGGIKVAGGEKLNPKPAEGKEGEETPKQPPQEQTKTPPPTGFVGSQPPRKPDNVLLDGKRVIDELYAIENDYTKPQHERDLATRKIQELFGAAVKGVRQTMRLPHITVLDCPACHQVMEGTICQHCGYELKPYEQKTFGQIMRGI